MNKLMFDFRRYMDETTATTGENGGGGTGGEGGGTGGTGGEGGGEGGKGGEGGGAGSAFAQKGGAGGEGGGEGGKGGEGGGTGSAFAQKGGAGGEGGGKGGENEPKDPTREELLAMKDEDWAKGVLPEDKDAEGNEIDRTFMTNMAKVCREAGITPRQMQAMSGRFMELARAEQKVQDDAAAAKQAEIDKANEAATKAAVERFNDREWDDIRAAGQKYIPAGSELEKLMNGPLGSNIELLNILNVVGKSLRGATTGTTGAAGSGDYDAGMAVIKKTVPSRYLK